MIEVVQGDICDVGCQYIAHQCNCVTTHAAHLARQIFTKYPYADIYLDRIYSKIKTIKDLPMDQRPGRIVVSGNGIGQRYVINMLGQVFPGRPRFITGMDTEKLREHYFLQCLWRVSRISGLREVAFPYGIGCGAAGGDWLKYEMSIREYADANGDVSVYLVKLR